MVTVFDVLLGVVPCATSVAEVVSHQLASKNHACQERTECCIADSKADNHRRKHGEERWSGEFTQRCCGADVNDWTVVGLFGAVHNFAVFELIAYFLHDNTSGSSDCTNCKCRKHKCNRTTN